MPDGFVTKFAIIIDEQCRQFGADWFCWRVTGHLGVLLIDVLNAPIKIRNCACASTRSVMSTGMVMR
jgi:hypothetical protein